jgi:hypothetical protein
MVRPCVAEFPESRTGEVSSSGVNVIGISADEVADLQSKVVPFVRDAKARFLFMFRMKTRRD